MELLTRMVEHNIWPAGEMIERASNLSDDVLDERIEVSVEDLDDKPTLGSQLSRLVEQLAMWTPRSTRRHRPRRRRPDALGQPARLTR
ncbi:MAG TPA: hypothetical protein VH210_17105 [Gaiellaceae bacterium]|jgi:hypothetical protein|nr:hypothetical protein [Gaiellaceae bacterium]